MPIIIGVIAVLLVGLLAFIATRPDAFTVQRSAVIKAQPAVVHGLINDFRLWQQWSPWEQLDPELKRSYTGPDTGAGASYAWLGNAKAGEGRMTIEESKPGELVVIKLEFIKPFASTCPTTFRLTPEGEGTRVDWIMTGKNNFISKFFCLFMNMDSMVGKDFEKGLAGLDRAAQASAQ